MSSSHTPADKIVHKRSDLHIARKLWHMSTGVIGLILFFSSEQVPEFWGYGVLLIAVLGFLADYLRQKNPLFNKFVIMLMGPLMRKSEREGVSGLPFYALGIALSLLFYQKDLALISIMFLIFSDPVSSFFGVLYGKDKILPNKSLQGFVAGFFTCYLVTLFYLLNLGQTSIDMLTFSLVAGLIGAGSELISAFNIDDNLTIPVISGLGLTILNHFLPII
ncbi:MAG: phosphatidate cytidylyltransferase [Candidatus Caldatribacteriota bacterium]